MNVMKNISGETVHERISRVPAEMGTEKQRSPFNVTQHVWIEQNQAYVNEDK